ncbi:unnamed protein product [Schistosoma mattheei]|uniref:Uncharacterized protein n=1 Tax=Schistosoma mattheei TaxID=31246 RepID=A0AA85BYF0_9TREM|nr:unnamed protein product [Schistosoma mattheei]
MVLDLVKLNSYSSICDHDGDDDGDLLLWTIECDFIFVSFLYSYMIFIYGTCCPWKPAFSHDLNCTQTNSSS